MTSYREKNNMYNWRQTQLIFDFTNPRKCCRKAIGNCDGLTLLSACQDLESTKKYSSGWVGLWRQLQQINRGLLLELEFLLQERYRCKKFGEFSMLFTELCFTKVFVSIPLLLLLDCCWHASLTSDSSLLAFPSNLTANEALNIVQVRVDLLRTLGWLKEY